MASVQIAARTGPNIKTKPPHNPAPIRDEIASRSA